MLLLCKKSIMLQTGHTHNIREHLAYVYAIKSGWLDKRGKTSRGPGLDIKNTSLFLHRKAQKKRESFKSDWRCIMQNYITLNNLKKKILKSFYLLKITSFDLCNLITFNILCFSLFWSPVSKLTKLKLCVDYPLNGSKVWAA